MDVAVIRWPAEADERAHLGAARRPCLLLLPDGEAPPVLDDCLEDWARASASDEEVRARLATLSARARTHLTDRPDLDEDGLLRFRGAWLSLPPVELRLTRALVERFGALVTREALTRAGWPEGGPGRNALDVHVLRLRRRLLPLGLTIRTVRSRGYLLEEESDFRQDRVREASHTGHGPANLIP